MNQANNVILVMSYKKRNSSKYNKCSYRGYSFSYVNMNETD